MEPNNKTIKKTKVIFPGGGNASVRSKPRLTTSEHPNEPALNYNLSERPSLTRRTKRNINVNASVDISKNMDLRDGFFNGQKSL